MQKKGHEQNRSQFDSFSMKKRQKEIIEKQPPKNYFTLVCFSADSMIKLKKFD